MTKISVKIKLGDKLVIPNFSQCLVSLLQEKINNSIVVNFKLFDDYLLISKYEESNYSNSDKCTLHHSVHCPMRDIPPALITIDQLNRTIPVAVSIIVQSSNHRILMTKRSSKMNSSPGTWVPPGGHLEPGESLIGGGLREVYEETGLRFKENDVRCELLAIWENVYPILLGFGAPKQHVLVFYYRILSNKTHHQLNKLLKINLKEVQSYTWFSPEVLEDIFSLAKIQSHQQDQYVYSNGAIKRSNLEYLTIWPRVVWGSKDLYTGVQCALTNWYHLYCSENGRESTLCVSKI